MSFSASQLAKWKWLVLGLFLLGLVGLYLLFPIREWIFRFCDTAKNLGPAGAVIYVAVYVVATILLFPCALLTFTAGLLYGIWGFPLVVVSSALGASCAFLISRHFVKDKVDAYMDQRPTTRALKKAIQNEGWKFMLLLRVSPVIPFNLNNYFLGTVQVRFLTYLWVTVLGAIPGTSLYVYLGTLGLGIGHAKRIEWLLFALGLAATFWLVRITRRKTQEILRSTEGVA